MLAGEPLHRRLGSVLSVHNAGFQGHFPSETVAALGLPADLYNPRVFEWYGRMNILKGGLTFADLAVTVSPTHARERSEEHTSELQSQSNLVCRLLLEKKK